MTKEYSTPGPRAIHPDICDSRSLAKCGIVANALWPRLIALADDQGRLAGDAVDVLGLCFPKMLDRVSVRQVKAALEELERVGMVKRYEVSGEPYLQIVSWWEWQASMRRAYPSRHPAPEGWDDAVYGFNEHPGTYREVRGIDPRKRKFEDDPEDDGDESSPEPQPHGAGNFAPPQPHGAGNFSNPEPHGAGTVPAAEPHGAANARAQPHARVPAQPPVRVARPDLTRPDSPTSTPPRRGGARNGRTTKGHVTDPRAAQYEALAQRDSDEADEHLPFATGGEL